MEGSDWTSKTSLMYVIYPIFYWVAELWPMIFLFYKLIFSRYLYHHYRYNNNKNNKNNKNIECNIPHFSHRPSAVLLHLLLLLLLLYRHHLSLDIESQRMQTYLDPRTESFTGNHNNNNNGTNKNDIIPRPSTLSSNVSSR